MKEHEDDLISEARDKQSGSWSDELSPQERDLIQYMRAHSQEYVRENENSLDRIWSRIAQRKEHPVFLPQRWRAPGENDFNLKDRKVMQEKTNSRGTYSPLDIPQTNKRSFPRRVLVNGLVAAVAILAVGTFAIFTTLARSGIPPTTVGAGRPVQSSAQQPVQPKVISHGEPVCSVSNKNATLSNGEWFLPTLDWSSQGEVASAFSNLKTFSAKDCTVLSSQATQTISANWSPDGQKLATLTTRSISVLDDNKTHFVIHASGDILVQDRHGNTIAQFTPQALGAGWISAAFWTPDGKKLIIFSSDAGAPTDSVKSVEAVSGGKVTTLLKFDVAAAPASRVPELISLSPDGKLVAVDLLNIVKTQTGATTNGTGGVEIWNLESGKKVSTIALKQSGLLSASLFAWSPDGSQLALVTGDRGDTVQIYATASGTSLSSFKDNNATSAQGIGALAWSPDGSFLAESAAAIRIWDVRAQKIVATFGQVDAHHLVAGLAWSPDSNELVSATINMPFSTGDNSQNIMNVWKLS